MVSTPDGSPRRGRLSARALVGIGIASYAIYLVHEPIVATIVQRMHGPLAYAAAAATALSAGIAFWYVAERPFTSGPLRRPLLNAVLPLMRRCCRWAGIPEIAPLPAPPPIAVESPARAPIDVTTIELQPG